MYVLLCEPVGVIGLNLPSYEIFYFRLAFCVVQLERYEVSGGNQIQFCIWTCSILQNCGHHYLLETV
jgi:hypothetical protein